jgi:NAD-dependent histone deacetylase SIR2
LWVFVSEHRTQSDPSLVYAFAEDFDPTKFRPTLAHSFIRLLDRKQRLRMAFTQNIDGLERRAHIDAERLVEAHGTIVTQHCVACGEVAEAAEMWAHVRRGEVYYCPACDGAVKPDIVFFGEAVRRTLPHSPLR